MNIPWGLVVCSIVGCVILRPIFTDDVDYLVAALIYDLVLGFVNAILEVKYDD